MAFYQYDTYNRGISEVPVIDYKRVYVSIEWDHVYGDGLAKYTVHVMSDPANRGDMFFVVKTHDRKTAAELFSRTCFFYGHLFPYEKHGLEPIEQQGIRR